MNIRINNKAKVCWNCKWAMNSTNIICTNPENIRRKAEPSGDYRNIIVTSVSLCDRFARKVKF